jgi:hypothetical protein
MNLRWLADNLPPNTDNTTHDRPQTRPIENASHRKHYTICDGPCAADNASHSLRDVGIAESNIVAPLLATRHADL